MRAKSDRSGISLSPHTADLLATLSSIAVNIQRERTFDGVIRAVGEALVARGLTFSVLQVDGSVTRLRYFNQTKQVRGRRHDGERHEGRVVPLIQMLRSAAQKGSALLLEDMGATTERIDLNGSLEGEPKPPWTSTPDERIALQALTFDDVLWGGFTVGSTQLSFHDEPTVSLFGTQLNAVLQAAMAQERLQQRAREFDAINALATMRFERVQDTATMLGKIIESTGSDAAVLYLYDAATHEYVMFDKPVGTPSSFHAQFKRFRSTEGMEQQKTAHVSELTLGAAEMEGAGFQWVANLPLMAEGRPLAWVSLARKRPMPYTPDELRTAAILGVLVSSLLERSRLYDQLSERVRQLTLLFELARAGAGAREVTPLMDQLLVLLLDNLPCDAASVLYARGTELSLGAWKVRPESGLPVHIALSNIPFDDTSVTGRTLRYLKAMKVSLHDAPARTRLEMEAFGAQHMMAAPMVVGERHFGALVALRLSDSSFSEYDLRLMESCCAQVSLLVEHVKLFDDLTQSYANLEQAQAEVVRHARLAALGELSAVMAHEVRNPLGVIFNSLASLKRRSSNDEQSKMLLDMVSEEADRLNRIVGDLLDFAKPYEADRGWVDLKPLMESAIEAGRSNASANVTVHAEVAQGLPKLLLDGHLLRQALINLIVNAIQAMPNGGNIWVRGSSVERNGGVWAVIEVQDEGEGISPAAEKQIFQPFFTTKATGTGLGLAVVKRIVDAHHGEVSVDTEAGRGTTFTLLLPSS